MARAFHDQMPQPAVFGVTVGDIERRQLRGDQGQPERALLAEVGGGRHDFGIVCEELRHLRSRSQVRTPQRGKVTGSLVHGVPSPDRTHGHGQPAAGRFGEMGPGGGDDADAEPGRQFGQDRIAFVVERDAHGG